MMDKRGHGGRTPSPCARWLDGGSADHATGTGMGACITFLVDGNEHDTDDTEAGVRSGLRCDEMSRPGAQGVSR